MGVATSAKAATERTAANPEGKSSMKKRLELVGCHNTPNA
jgi:hypothetical protein